MSLFYFAAGEDTAHDGYRLLLDSARWADTHGFEAVWTPERHFHAFGGAYPNPAVVGAAVAAVTTNVRIRAGSVVAPLHSPARIAEEWAVVDNLSGGRVDMSFAAGWQPNDFVLNPGAYATARDQLPIMIDTVRRLWRGDTVDMPGHDGAPVAVRTLPRPVQPELPVWLTSAGSTSTFERAGTLGTNLLTHLLGQSIEQLAENIACYRAAWKAAGHPGQGQVTLMLHTYLHPDSAEARRVAHGPMKAYLGTAAGLLKNMASAFPTFAGSGKSADEAFASLTADELDQLLEMAAGRYLETSGLFGTVDDAVDMIEHCSRAGVDEVACLIDFGVDTDAVLDSLPLLEAAYGRVADARRHVTGAERADESAEVDESVADLVARHRVTHLQCTPSLATMLVADPADRAALGTIGHVMLGGEPLPTALAAELTGAAARAAHQHVRADRDHDLVARARARPSRPPVRSRSADRSGTTRSTCSTHAATRCRSARSANCTSAATASPAATTTVLSSRGSGSSTGPGSAGSTRPATSSASAPTAWSSSPVDPTTRSRSAATASNSARSRRSSTPTPTWCSRSSSLIAPTSATRR